MILDRIGRRDGWLAVAHAVAQRADCSRSQVGAVIVGADDRVISTGRNGLRAGVPGCLSGACPRGRMSYQDVQANRGYDEAGPGSCKAIHAEMNALIYARASVVGATLYVTRAPCPGCAKHIEAAGIVEVVVA